MGWVECTDGQFKRTRTEAHTWIDGGWHIIVFICPYFSFSNCLLHSCGFKIDIDRTYNTITIMKEIKQLSRKSQFLSSQYKISPSFSVFTFLLCNVLIQTLECSRQIISILIMSYCIELCCIEFYLILFHDHWFDCPLLHVI